MMDRLTDEVPQKSPLAVMSADDTALRSAGSMRKKTWRNSDTGKGGNQKSVTAGKDKEVATSQKTIGA